MTNHDCGVSLCLICVHLKAGGDWWGVPDGEEFYDWMCSDCIEQFKNDDCPDPTEVELVCADCVRSKQANSRLHHPMEHGDGSWSYEDELVFRPGEPRTE